MDTSKVLASIILLVTNKVSTKEIRLYFLYEYSVIFSFIVVISQYNIIITTVRYSIGVFTAKSNVDLARLLEKNKEWIFLSSSTFEY